jgi:hypothetical protein
MRGPTLRTDDGDSRLKAPSLAVLSVLEDEAAIIVGRERTGPPERALGLVSAMHFLDLINSDAVSSVGRRRMRRRSAGAGVGAPPAASRL